MIECIFYTYTTHRTNTIFGTRNSSLANTKINVTLPILLCFTLYFQVQAPKGLYSEGRFNGGFFAIRVLGAYI